MSKNQQKAAGFALILGSLLLTVTMVLHPTGGNFEHLLKMTKMIVVSHSLAILSIPFCVFGFWGFYKSFRQDQNLSAFSFTVIALGLVAIMLAGALNGLTLPIFINSYKDATPETIEMLKPILRYNMALNHTFDYIFLGAICISVVLWCIAILRTKTYPAWLAYFGIGLTLLFLVGVSFNFNFINLLGFRVFVFALVGWLVAVGVLMIRKKVENE
jgi:hypothetical protein